MGQGLGLCALLLLFTLMLMRDLGTTMASHGRQQDGNLLIAEAQAAQMDGIRHWATRTGSSVRALRPFLYAQLVAVNGRQLAAHVQRPSDTFATLSEPIRLSWTDTLPTNNQIAGGRWWPIGTEQWQQISAEAEVMTDLGLQYGDRLTYRIAGRPYEFTLVASHTHRAGGGSITFWFQVPLSARTHIESPTLFMGSLELPPQAWQALAELWRRYPSLSLVPLRELTERFDRTLGIVIRVTSGYAVMVLLLALIVLAASVSGFSADDRQKNGLLMSMGLKQRDCLWLNFHDWGITALIAAAGAIMGTLDRRTAHLSEPVRPRVQAGHPVGGRRGGGHYIGGVSRGVSGVPAKPRGLRAGLADDVNNGRRGDRMPCACDRRSWPTCRRSAKLHEGARVSVNMPLSTLSSCFATWSPIACASDHLPLLHD